MKSKNFDISSWGNSIHSLTPNFGFFHPAQASNPPLGTNAANPYQNPYPFSTFPIWLGLGLGLGVRVRVRVRVRG